MPASMEISVLAEEVRPESEGLVTQHFASSICNSFKALSKCCRNRLMP